MNNSIRNRKIYYLMNQIIEKISIVGIKIKYHPNDRENNQQLRYWQWTSNAFLSFYLPHRSEQIFFFNTLEKISNTINSSSCSEELYWDMSFANWFVLSWLRPFDFQFRILSSKDKSNSKRQTTRSTHLSIYW
jgi:hypothetical protein